MSFGQTIMKLAFMQPLFLNNNIYAEACIVLNFAIPVAVCATR